MSGQFKRWSRFSSSIFLFAIMGLCGCSNAKNRALCEQAATRWESCTREVLGEEMAQIAESRRDIDACVDDAATVAMYERCLPQPTCQGLMDCLMGAPPTTP